MNEQLQTELAAWLGKLREAADAGASFALEQAPLIVQEKVAYGRVSHTAFTLMLAAFAFFAWRGVWRHIASNQKKPRYEFIENDPAVVVFGGGAAALATLLALVTADYAMQAWFAPRLYVLEWLAGLLK